jgi:hypothetical protein
MGTPFVDDRSPSVTGALLNEHSGFRRHQPCPSMTLCQELDRTKRENTRAKFALRRRDDASLNSDLLVLFLIDVIDD